MTSMTITVLSRDGLRRAVVGAGSIRYFRATPAPGDAPMVWYFDHEANPALPFHALLDLATRIVNAPAKVGRI